MNIFVAKLSFDTQSEDLQEAFEAFGTVSSANVIHDKFTGRSKGFGFVEMADANEAQSAIGALDQKDFNGRNLRVNEANPRPPRGEGGGGGGDRRGGGGYGGGGGRRDRY